MEEKSAKARTTSSKAKWKVNPGNIDDTSVGDLKGFRQAKETRDDPAYKAILSKCSKGTVDTFTGNTIPVLLPPQHTAHDDFKEWSRGKSKEPK